VDQEAEKGNKFALLARSLLFRTKRSKSQVRKDLEKAIQIDRHFVAALEARASIAIEDLDFHDASRDLATCLEVAKSESQRWSIQHSL
jgi:Tfp pilus assembly protein PilF